MIYNSLDIIPLKLFMKILETDDFTLLTDSNDKDVIDSCKLILSKLKDDYDDLGLVNNYDSLLNINVRIEALKFKYDAIIAAVQSLRFDRNKDLLEMLKSFRYTIREDTYIEDLDRIEREVDSINVKIRRLEKKLPKKTKSEKTTIDKVIMSYCALTGSNYNTNEITVIQFHALKSLAEDKMKSIEKENAKLISKNKRNGRGNNNA